MPYHPLPFHRRHGLALALLLALSLVVAACAGRATPTPEPTATSVPTVAPTPTPEPTATPTPEPAVTTLIEDFEGSPQLSANDNTQAALGDVAYNGSRSLKSESSEGEWHTVGVAFAQPLDFSRHQALCFFVYDTTAFNNGRAANTVGVKLYDADGKSVERYSDNEGVGDNPKTRKDRWTPICMNLISFTGIDQTRIGKVEFTMYWPGVYYFDDLTLLARGDTLAVKEQPEEEGPTQEVVLQDFEGEGEMFYADYQAEVSLATDVVHGGKGSLKAVGPSGEWHAFGAYPAARPFDASGFGRLCFWIYDTTTFNDGKADNTVGVRLFDATGANQEVWTDNPDAGENPKTVTNEWVPMCMNLDAYTEVDLTQLDKVQFAMYWPGTYYVDDITLVGVGTAAAKPAPPRLMAQDFEGEGEMAYPDYQAEVSIVNDVVHSGKAAMKAVGPSGEWHAFGAYLSPRPFDATGYGRVCFWFNDTTTNNDGKADNTVGVRLFDATGANQEVWTDHEAAGANPKTVTNEWVHMCINLAAYTELDLTQLDKIQFAMYWPGTYYVDDIEFVRGEVAAAAHVAQDFEGEGEMAYPDYQA
ncbi:MAG: hypothetical protein RMN53_15240, partial [Anaerolineae bacterium]|nr:hypothetical protein [Anaerolineae bacterium]